VLIANVGPKEIILTCDILSKILNIPNTNVKYYGDDDWYKSSGLDRNTILSQFFLKFNPDKGFLAISLKN